MSETTRQADRESPPPRPRETAQQRARRMPLDYYKGLTRLDFAKWLLTGLVCTAAAGYIAWTMLGWADGNEQAARQFSPAPVASVHAAWDGKCAACHVLGTSQRQDGQAVSLTSSVLAGRPAADRAAADAACQACHAGPPHHANQLAGEVWACAGCHRDHQGRDADLTRMADTACTRCHADIARHREGPSQLNPATHNVSSFAVDHPPFRSLNERDRGRMRFNHRLHMLPGQAPNDAKDSAKKTLADVPKQFRAALVHPQSLADVPLTTVIQLDCADCHQTDTGSIPAQGAYMQPINFERHCAACHSGELVAEVAAGGQVAALQLPHGLLPQAIQPLLAGLVNPPTGDVDLTPAAPLQPIPGKTPGENLAQTTEPAAAARIAAAEQALRGEHRCGKCHEFEQSAVVPPRTPSVWFAHARFDHSSHRAMKCFDCHEQERLESTANGKPPLDDRRPILPDIDNCRRCHAPTTAHGTTGARHDCAECHRYHGGDLSPHGRGALGRGVPTNQRLDGLQWISGSRSP